MQNAIFAVTQFSFSPWEKEGPAPRAWEDEGDQVIHWRDLIPRTLPLRSAMGPTLAPMGRGKVREFIYCITAVCLYLSPSTTNLPI